MNARQFMSVRCMSPLAHIVQSAASEEFACEAEDKRGAIRDVKVGLPYRNPQSSFLSHLSIPLQS